MKMSENNDYIQLPPLKKDTPADVVALDVYKRQDGRVSPETG